MRKLLFVLIAVVMLSVFTGCSQSGTTQTDEESAEDSGEVYKVSYATALAPASDFHQEIELVILNSAS
jgi:ABC-type Zn uptake system ZnuABC Zn-binding protein ZnuA